MPLQAQVEQREQIFDQEHEERLPTGPVPGRPPPRCALKGTPQVLHSLLEPIPQQQQRERVPRIAICVARCTRQHQVTPGSEQQAAEVGYKCTPQLQHPV